MSAISHESTISDVLAEAARTRERDAVVGEQLRRLAGERRALERRLASAPAAAGPDADAFRDEAEKLSRSVGRTSRSAQALSSKVRALDTAQHRLQAALARVEAAVDLRDTAGTVAEALAKGDLAAAARGTHRLLHTTKEEGPSPAPAPAGLERLRALEEEVRVRVVAEADRAEAAGDSEGLLERCRLLPLLGLPFQGLRRYCAATAASLAAQMRHDGLTLGSQPRGAVLSFVDMLSKILDRAAGCVKRHERGVREHFGPGAHLRLIQELHRLCDEQLERLVRRFVEQRGVGRICDAVRAADADAEAAAAAVPPASELDDLLEEMAFMAREAEIFDINLRERARRALAALEGAPRQAALLEALRADPMGDRLPHVSRLNQAVQEVVGHYIGLEEHVMLHNVQLAVGLDEPLPGGLGSTMVDEVFYVLKRSTERAFSTCSVVTACALTNHVNGILTREFKQTLERALRRSAAAAAGGAAAHLDKVRSMFKDGTGKDGDSGSGVGVDVGGGGDGGGGADDDAKDAAARSLCVTLNNVQTSGEHILTLKRHLEREFSGMYEAVDTKGMVAQCLADLEDTSKSYRTMLHKSLVVLTNRIGQDLRPELERMVAISYDLTERQYAEREVNDPFVDEFLARLGGALRPLRPRLGDDVFDRLLHTLVQYVTKRVEGIALSKRFSFWGGLQFDKDVRKLTAFFSAECRKSVRDKFARLTQMSSILQLERAEEIHEYWDAGERGVWRLEPAEVRHVLGLRFAASDVATVRL